MDDETGSSTGWRPVHREAVIAFRLLATVAVAWVQQGFGSLLATKRQANSTSFGMSLCRRTIISENISGGDRDRGVRLDRLCDIFITSSLVLRDSISLLIIPTNARIGNASGPSPANSRSAL
jgi:hypothetical protein